MQRVGQLTAVAMLRLLAVNSRYVARGRIIAGAPACSSVGPLLSHREGSLSACQPITTITSTAATTAAETTSLDAAAAISPASHHFSTSPSLDVETSYPDKTLQRPLTKPNYNLMEEYEKMMAQTEEERGEFSGSLFPP